MSESIGEILTGSFTAAVCTTPHAPGPRVYFQDADGYIRESWWAAEVGAWRGGTYRNILFRAKLGTALAAVAYGGGEYIRIYYQDRRGNLQEYCKNPGRDWFLGKFGASVPLPLQDTRIAAFAMPGPHLRVYVQRQDGFLQEYCNNPDGKGWFAGHIFNSANCLLGTSLAASCDEHMRVYYQDTRGWIHEIALIENWKETSFRIEAPLKTPLAVLAWGRGTLSHLYYRSFSGDIIELSRNTKWNASPRVLPRASIENSQLSACLEPNVRLYYQNEPGKLQEFCSATWAVHEKSDTVSGHWVLGSVIPTGSTE